MEYPRPWFAPVEQRQSYTLGMPFFQYVPVMKTTDDLLVAILEKRYSGTC